MGWREAREMERGFWEGGKVHGMEGGPWTEGKPMGLRERERLMGRRRSSWDGGGSRVEGGFI